ncbi:hypothetical protein [Microbacterium maritypicum]|uniref:hypothetical protein n=1 Tax=Microbacterium maritypicum TaxID=33918 RepID=UPI0038212BBE
MDLTQQWQAPSSGARSMRARVEYRLGGAHLEIDAVDYPGSAVVNAERYAQGEALPPHGRVLARIAVTSSRSPAMVNATFSDRNTIASFAR